MTIIELCAASIENAIKKYENSFSDKDPMSIERSQNIIEIRQFLKNHECEDIDQFIEKIKNLLKNFHTGWWVLETNQSRLKRLILDSVTPFGSILIRDNFAMLMDLHDQVAELRLVTGKKLENSDENTQRQFANNQIMQLQLENQWLKEQLEFQKVSHFANKSVMFNNHLYKTQTMSPLKADPNLNSPYSNFFK